MLKRSLPYFFLLLAVLLYGARLLALLNTTPGYIGFDYKFFIPRIFEGVLSFHSQGLVAPYYSSFLCGGYPLYADPQSMFYSLPQFLSFIVDPWTAIQIAILILLAISAAATFYLARNIFFLSDTAAFCAAFFFATNGFFRSRMMIGHLSFHGFLYIPLLSIALLIPLKSTLLPGLAFGFALAVIIHGGAHYVTLFSLISTVLLVALSLVIAAPGKSADIKAVLTRAAVGIVFGLGLSISKITAAFSLMSSHSRRAHFDRLESFSEAARLLYAQFIDPLASAPLKWGIWEYDTSLAVMVWPGIFLVLLQALLRLRAGKVTFSRRTAALGFFLFISTLVLIVSCGHSGSLQLLKKLPVLDQMRLNMRFASTLILPLCLLSAFGYSVLEKWLKSKVIPSAVIALSIFSSFLGAERMASVAPTLMAFDSSEIKPFYKRVVDNGATVREIGPGQSDDFKAMVNLQANPRCYTAILGDRPPTRRLHTGLVTELRDGNYNSINPACYWYPKENNCKAGTLIKVTEQKNFETLLAHINPDWKISTAQRIANYLNLFAFITFFTSAGFLLIRRIKPTHIRRSQVQLSRNLL